MDKEKIITIGIGLLVGVSAAAIYFAATRYLPSLRPQDKVTFNTASPKPSANKQLTLTLNKPDDHTSTTDNPMIVSGQTKAGAKLVFFANAEEKVASAGGQGQFSTNLKLEEGENEISVMAIDDQGNMTVVKRNVTLEISP